MSISFSLEAANELTHLAVGPTTDDTVDGILGWLEKHVTSPAQMHELLYYCATMAANFLAKATGRETPIMPGNELNPDTMVGILNVANLPEDDPDLIATRLVAAAGNGDGDMLGALIHAVIHTGAIDEHHLVMEASAKVALRLIAGPFRIYGRMALATLTKEARS